MALFNSNTQLFNDDTQTQGQLSVDGVRNQMLANIAKYLAILVGPPPTGGTLTLNVRTVTSATPVQTNDYALRCDATSAPFAVTLPAVATSAGRFFEFKKVDGTTNAVTIQGDSYIDGAPSYSLNFENQSVQLGCNGVSWDVYE